MNNQLKDLRIELEKWLQHNPRTLPAELSQRREEFWARFPKDKLGEMTMEQYALGFATKDSFCYWLEFKTRRLGGIRGGSAAKFGLYWSKSDNAWKWDAKYKTPEDAFAQIQEGLIRLVRAAEAKQYEDLDSIGSQWLGPNRRVLRMKTLSLYFPQDFMPAFQRDHLKYFLALFGQKADGDIVSRNRQLLKIMQSLPEFQGFDPMMMCFFLYKHMAPWTEKPKSEKSDENSAGAFARKRDLKKNRLGREKSGIHYRGAEPEIGLEDVHPELEPEVEPEIPEVDDRPVVSHPTDWAIATLRDTDDKGKIDRQPRYQRRYVWELKPELPSRLIESILLEIPIPPIYLGKVPGGRLEVIDGQQRLTTLLRFVRNDFALQKLRRLPSLNGLVFRDLSEEQQDKILHTPIHSVVIDAGRNENLRYEVFERLNRGSMALNEQELRNCIYHGSFSDLLEELETSEIWRKVKGTPEPEPRFAEREMILRFFAFAERMDHYRGNLRQFLNEYMEHYAPRDPAQPQDPEKIAALRAKFKQTMQNVYAVFGERSGRLYSTGTEDHPTIDGKWEPKFSIAALDIQASALMGHTPARAQAAAEQIRELYLFYLLTNPQVRLAISRQPAGTNATRTRWFGFKGLVQEVMNNTNPEPRFFSYDLRRQLYDEYERKGKGCAICGNEIHSFEDCTIDHIIPYARGGKTVPSNAQLTHRSCNARKYTTVVEPTLSEDPFADARILLQVGHIIPAGAIAGLVLERQLKLLCDHHQPPVTYERGAGINRLNELLKGAGVYDVSESRLVQWMGDIRNRCDHPTDKPPTREDVDKLLREVKSFVTSHPA